MRASPDPDSLSVAPAPADNDSAAAAVPRRWRDQLLRLVQLLLLALCYALIAHASLSLAFDDTNATPVWPLSGIAFAAVLLAGYRVWPAIMLGAFSANLATFLSNDIPLSTSLTLASLAMASGNTLEALMGAWMVRRYTDVRQPIGQLQNVYKFALIALAMCVPAAGTGASTLVLAGLAPPSEYATIMLTWWIGDTAGVLLVAPAIVIWCLHGVPPWRWRVALEAALSLAGLAGLIALVFWSDHTAGDGYGWTPYLMVLCVAWAAHRHGLRGASIVCLCTAGAAIIGTVNGFGPFAVGTRNDALISLDSFIVLCSLIGMVLCADASERRRLRPEAPHHSAAQWSTLLIGVALTVVVWHLVAAETERRAGEKFDTDGEDIAQRIERRMKLYEAGLRGAQALFKAEQDPSRAQWHDFAAGLDLAHNFPGVMGLGYAAYVQRDQRQALEARVRSQGYPDFHIWSQAGAPSNSNSAAVLYIEPFDGRNLRAFGYDMLSEPHRQVALLNAARSGMPAVTQKVALVQDTQGVSQPGFLVYFPVYRRQAGVDGGATPAQRMAALQGYAYSPIRADELMAGLLGPSEHELRLEIFDGDSTDSAARLYASAPDRSAADQRQYPNPYQRVRQLDLLQHRWTLRFTSLPAFEKNIDRQKSHIVLVAGVIISLLFFGVVRALTARQAYATALARHMTGALRKSESSLIDARDLAEAASRAKTEFVANMSHEIRTPLNAVLGMTHLLNQTPLAPEQQKYLDMIRTAGNSLLNILNDVLDLSKIEAGRMELAPAPFQLGAVLEAAATIMTVNAGEKDLELAIGIHPEVPQALVGDSHRLQQVLVNLVGNAIKFTEKGSVSLLVERVDDGDGSPSQAGVTLRFTVSDSGIGIPEEDIAGLFAPFSQADASMTRRFGGTGLGLAISRRLAQLMGGAIAVRSTPGVGSDFVLTVPLRRAAATPVDPAVDSAVDAAVDPVVGAMSPHVLVVDDDRLSADYLCQSVRANGWRADSADSGERALTLMRGAGKRYDAVLVDWCMPGMNGLATMDAIRALQPEGALPVILMVSAFGQGKLLHSGGAADAVLLKPVTCARLQEALRQAQGAAAARGLAGAAPNEQQHGGADGAPTGLRLDGVRLLLVEDNPINQLVAKGMLSHAGALVDSVDNGRAALELLRGQSERYDLVLMDVQMPEMDGFEATTRIRAELGAAVPIVAMTAGVMASEREQCIACGMDDFIAKPIDVEDMLRTIGRNLRANSTTTATAHHQADRTA